MFCRNQSNRGREHRHPGAKIGRNRTLLAEALDWLIPTGVLFTKDQFHGNIKWEPEQLAQQAVIWAWQDANNVTDAFEMALEVCEDMKIKNIAKTYTGFINALDRYRAIFALRLRLQYQSLAEEIGGRFWRDRGWMLIGFDGSRVTMPQTVSNEREFCAPNYGQGRRQSIARRKAKGCDAARTRRTSPNRKRPRPGSR